MAWAAFWGKRTSMVELDEGVVDVDGVLCFR